MLKESRDFYDLVLRFNRRLEGITAKLKPPLHVNESHILAELFIEGYRTPTEISDAVRIEKSLLSRMLEALKKRGLLEKSRSEVDKRSLHIALTKKGERLFLDDSGWRNHQTIEFLAPLSRLERLEIAKLLSLIADRFGAPELAGFEGDPPGKIEVRRLTRVLGVLGGNFMRTGMRVEHCQILRLLAAFSERASMKTLRDALPYESSTLSRLIADLEAQKLLKRERVNSDKRQLTVSITSTGLDRDSANQKTVNGGILHVIQDVTPQNLSKILTLLHKALSNAAFEERHLTTAHRIAKIDSDHDTALARAFVMEEAVEAKRHLFAPEKLLSKKSIRFGIFKGDEVAGVSEAVKLDKDRWRLNVFLFSDSLKSTGYPVELLKRTLSAVSDRRSGRSLEFPASESSFVGLPPLPIAAPRKGFHLSKADLRILLKQLING